MRPIFLLLQLICAFSLSNLQAQDWKFAKRYSATAGSTLSNAAVATAPDGSIYVVGIMKGNAVFDTIQASTPTNANWGYLLKLNTSAQAVWVKFFAEKPYHVSTDAQNNVFIGGAISAGSNQADSLAFVAKYNPSGQQLGYFKAGGTARSWVKVLRLDAAGKCYATGWKSGEAFFGNISLASSNSRDNFLIRLSSDLSQVDWAVQTGSTNNLDEVNALELDNNGGVYTSGNYSQNYSLGCFCYNGSFFTEKRNAATGQFMWQYLFSSGSGTSTKQVLSLSADGLSVYTTASFKGTVQITPNISLTAQTGTDDYQMFVAKLSAASGTVQWAKKVTFTGDSYIAGSAWHEQALHLHGYFYSTTLFGSVLLEPQGSVDAFYGQIDPGDGSVALAERFTGTGSDLGLGINAENDALTLSGNSSSTVLHIDSFSVVGNFNSIYVVGTALVAPLNITEIAVSNASCPDLADGSATITVSGGTAPFTYTWSDGQTTASATSLLPGVYMVTATDHVGVQITDSVNIGAPMPLVAGFSNVVSNLTATFSNTSENASAYIWTFGDGESSAATDPMHTYLNAGTYAITLIAMNNCGADTFSQILVLSPNGAAPTANFMADKVELCIGMDDTLHFINQSVNGLTYLWSFPGGMPSMSMDENPAVVYSMPGIYTVILTASNAFGQDVATKTAYISVIALPIAAFEVVISGLQVTLTNNAQFGSDFQWEFGDNTTSTLVAPVHTYQAAGNYIIRLAVQNVCGASIVEKIVSVGMVATATPEWQEGLRIYPNPNKGTFTIEFNSQLNQDLELSLFSPEGKLLRQEMRGVHVGKESQVFANEGLPEGIYLLRVRENAQSKFLRVVVHH